MGSIPKKLSKELSNAVYDDFKRKVIDEAKKRAVSQHVDYETFKNMTLVAHLKPINAENIKTNCSFAPSWSFTSDGMEEKNLETEALQIYVNRPKNIPKSNTDFIKDWKSKCPTTEDKYRYLQFCGSEVLCKVLKIEVNTDVLKGIIDALSTNWLCQAGASEEASEGGAFVEASFVISILDAVRSGGRFDLSVKLIGAQSKQQLAQLFSDLEGAFTASHSLSEQNMIEKSSESDVSTVQLAEFKPLLDPNQLLVLRKAYGIQ